MAEFIIPLFDVEVYDYETEMWRKVAEFETLEAAVDLADNSWDGRLMALCLAVDRTFTLGGTRIVKYTGEIVWQRV